MPDLTNTRRGIVLILLATPGIVLMNTCAKVSSLSYVRSKWSFPRACSAECAGALYAANAAPVGFQTPTLLTHPAALIGLAAAVCVALVDISLRKLGQTDEPLTTVFYFILIGVLMTAPFVLVAGQRLENRLVPWLIGIGLFAALQAGSQDDDLSSGGSLTAFALYLYRDCMGGFGRLDSVEGLSLPGRYHRHAGRHRQQPVYRLARDPLKPDPGTRLLHRSPDALAVIIHPDLI